MHFKLFDFIFSFYKKHVKLTLLITFEGLRCENEGNLYHGEKCYFLSEGTVRTFSEAQKACSLAREGSELVSITSEGLYRALISFVRSKITGRYNIWTSGMYNVSHILTLF